MSTLIGRVLADKYRLDAELGRGGMGIVLRGEHLVTGRAIAVKVLRAELAEDATLARRFVREVKAAAGIEHPNVVSVLDFGVEPDGTAFQVLELLEGESLADRLERGTLTPARALELLLPILHALELAHQRGVVHRDLKPENVFLSRNAHGRLVPKLLDFGIAKVKAPERPPGDRETHTTQHGTVIGTPAYMSPEQARGGEVGPGTDIWAMAVVLYECLSGQVPFDHENASIMMAKVMLERAPSLATVAPSVPRTIVSAIDAALAQEESGRPPSMAAFGRMLRAAALEAGVPLPPEGAADCPDDDPEGTPARDATPAAQRAPTGNASTRAAPAPTATRAPTSATHRARAKETPPSTALPVAIPTSPTSAVVDPSTAPRGRWELAAALAVVVIGGALWWAVRPSPIAEPPIAAPPAPPIAAVSVPPTSAAPPPAAPIDRASDEAPPAASAPPASSDGATRPASEGLSRPSGGHPARPSPPIETSETPAPARPEPPPERGSGLPEIREW